VAHVRAAQVDKVMGSVVGGTGMAPQPAPAPVPTSPPRPLVQGYGQSVHLFLAAVEQGMPLAAALVAFAHVGIGQFSHDFFPENGVLRPVADSIGLLHRAERLVVRGCEGEADSDMTLFLVGGAIAALVSEKRLRSQWLEETRRAAGGIESIPDFIALPRDEDGRPIIPGNSARRGARRVGVEAWHAGRCHPCDHEGPAVHAARLRPISAESVAQSPVVGEGRGRQVGARACDCQVAGVWRSRVCGMGRPHASFCFSLVVLSPRVQRRSIGS
jgi:hypothetical protein